MHYYFLLWITTLKSLILRGQRTWHILIGRCLSLSQHLRLCLGKEDSAFAILFFSVLCASITTCLIFFSKCYSQLAHEECKTHPVCNTVRILEVSQSSPTLDHSVKMKPFSQRAVEAFLLKTNVPSEMCRSQSSISFVTSPHRFNDIILRLLLS